MAETATTPEKYLKVLREHLDRFPGQPTDVAVMAYGLGMLEAAAAGGDINEVRAMLAAISEARRW